MDKYPAAQMVDLLKMLYQSEFGPGHLVADKAANRKSLEQEYERMAPHSSDYVEHIGSAFCRLHLHAIGHNGLTLDTFQRLFEMSANEVHGSTNGFLQKIEMLAQSASLTDKLTINNFGMKWLAGGQRPFSHSDAFKAAYSPAYRVVKAEYCRYLPLFAKIDTAMTKNPQTIVAIDGDAAAGKSTLAGMLKEVYDCNILPMDHFFLRPSQRTENRLAQPGGNVDYERFKKEVLEPTLAQKPFAYRPFDCRTWDFADEIAVTPSKLTIVEGSYAMHPELAAAYHITTFMKLDAQEQLRRILQRNGPEMAQKFKDIWIPMEKRYHTAFAVENNSHHIFSNPANS